MGLISNGVKRIALQHDVDTHRPAHWFMCSLLIIFNSFITGLVVFAEKSKELLVLRRKSSLRATGTDCGSLWRSSDVNHGRQNDLFLVHPNS